MNDVNVCFPILASVNGRIMFRTIYQNAAAIMIYSSNTEYLCENNSNFVHLLYLCQEKYYSENSIQQCSVSVQYEHM